MSVWIARDENQRLWVFEIKPVLGVDSFLPEYDDINDKVSDFFELDPENYKEVTFENSPVKMISAMKVGEIVKKEKQKQLESIIERVRDLCNIRQVLDYLRSTI